jgi:hypothetical protein
MMTPEERIKGLKKLLFREAAMHIFEWQRTNEGETRSWDDLSYEEQDARMEIAETFLKSEKPEVFANE